MATVEASFKACLTELRGETVSGRKRGAATAAQLLASPHALQYLDVQTKRSTEGGVTWAIFAGGVAKYVELEQPHVCATKRTTGQAPSTLFLNLMREAEKSSRITALGCHPLRARAGKLFQHVWLMLQDARSETPALIQDYTVVLRKHLLPVPDYCLKANIDTYKQLISVFMERLVKPHDDDARSMATLADLLHFCPVDLRSGELHELCLLLQSACDVCLESAEGTAMPPSRVVEPLLAACNALLVRFGADAAHSLSLLATPLIPLMTKVWGTTQALPKLKDECCLAARALLRVGVLQEVPGALRSVQVAVLAEVSRRAADLERVNRDERAGRGGAAPLTAASRMGGKMALELVAELWAHRLRGEPGWAAGSDASDGDGPRKRARVADEWSLIFDHVYGSPDALLPAFALLLHRFPDALPQQAHSRTAAALRSMLEPGLRAGPRGCDVAVALWALRCLRSIADAQGRTLGSAKGAPQEAPGDGDDGDDATVEPGASGNGLGGAPATPDVALWTAVLQTLWPFLDALKEGAAVLAPEVVHTACSIILHDLAPIPRAPGPAFMSVMMSSALSTRLGLLAAATLFSCRVDGAMVSLEQWEMQDRRRVTAWALRTLAPLPTEPVAMTGPRAKEEPPDAAGAADAALALCLGLKPRPEALARLPGWCDDDATDVALALLARGPDTRPLGAGDASPAEASEGAMRLTLATAQDLLQGTSDVLVTHMQGAREAAHALALVSVACRLRAVAARALVASLPDWLAPNGPLLNAARAALGAAEVALSANLHPRLLLTARLVAAAQDLGIHLTVEGASALRLTAAVIRVIDALKLAVHAGLASVQLEARNLAEDREMLFDDEDMGVEPAPGGATKRVDGTQYVGTQAPRGGVAVAESPLELGVGCIAALGRVQPNEAADALRGFLASSELPLAVIDAAVSALCALPDSPEDALIAAADVLTTSLVAIAKEGTNTPDAPRAPRLLHMVALLATRALRSDRPAGVTPMDTAGAEGPPRTLQSALVLLTDEVFGKTDEATSQCLAGLRSCGLSAGLALSRAVCQLIHPGNQDRSIVTAAGSLLGDRRYAVRRAMAPLFGSCVMRFAASEHSAIFTFARIYMVGLSASPMVESAPAMHETTVLQLAEMLLCSAAVGEEALFAMLELVATEQDTANIGLALNELSRVASRLGYPTRFALVQQHLAGVLHRWMLPGRSADSVIAAQQLLAPSPELVSSPPRDMARACAKYMLPAIVQLQAHDTLAGLAALCQQSTAELVAKHGHLALACVFLRRTLFRSKESDRLFQSETQSSEAVLVKAVGGQDKLVRIVGDGLIPIMTALLTMTVPPGGEDDVVAADAPQVKVAANPEAIAKAFDMLDSLVPADRRQSWWGDDVPLKLLITVHEAFDAGRADRHKALALARLSAMLCVLDKRTLLCVPAIFRYTITLLLRAVTRVELQATAVQLLDKVISKALSEGATGTAAEPLRQLLWPLSTRLVASVPSEPAPSEPAVLLLKKLVVNAPAWLAPTVAALDPFPEGEAWEPLRTSHEAMSQELPLEERLERFCYRACSMPANTRRSVAHALLDALRDTHAVARLHQADEAPSVAWQLATLCEQFADDSMHELAAAALAAVGVHDPFAVGFHVPSGRDFSQPESGSPGKRAASRKSAGQTSVKADADVTLAHTALRALCEFMLDGSASVVRKTLTALRHLLRMQHGAQAFRRLSDLEQSYLRVWQSSSAAAGSAADAEKQVPLGQPVPLNDDALWTPPPATGGPHAGRAYARWLCQLTHALVFECENATLRLCDPLLQRKAAFAEALLPHVFADLAAHRCANAANGAALRQLISHKMEHCILRNVDAGVRPLRLALTICAHLRSLHIAAGLRGLPAPGTVEAGNLSNPVTWSTVHWLDVEYLCVAEAALRVGACTTALQYVEHWCASPTGTQSLGGVDALNDAGPLPRHIAVALNAHADVGEPDGIYGCLNAPHLQLQLRLAEHEGVWNRALASHDASLQLESGGPHACAAAMGVLRSLLHLGCAYTANTAGATLLAHVASSSASTFSAADAQRFKDVQMEMAWRAGQWDSVDPATLANFTTADREPVPSVGDGFHACLAGALRALHTGEVARCNALLSRGRAGTVRSIALAGSESASAINANIVRLYALDEVRDIALARWGNLDSTVSTAGSTVSSGAASALETVWQETHVKSLGGRFDLTEPLLTARAAAMRAAGSVAGTTHALAASAAAAHAAGLSAVGLARIQEIKLACAAGLRHGGALETGLADVAGTGAPWRFEEARLLWADNQPELALALARALAEDPRGSDTASAVRGVTLLCTLGRWLAARHGESSGRIKSECFEKAIDILARASKDGPQQPLQEALCDAHFQLAQFLDNLHRMLGDRMSSQLWQQGQRLRDQLLQDMDSWKGQIATLRGQMAGMRDAEKKANEKLVENMNRRVKALSIQIQEEDQQRQDVQEQHTSAMVDCLRAYGSCLAAAGNHDTVALFRFVALWFKGEQHGALNAVASTIVRSPSGRGASVCAVPSAKFLPLVWQLVARLDASPEANATGFQTALHGLVQRLAVEHPYHTLYQLLALQASQLSSTTPAAPLTGKATAAVGILAHVRAASPRLKLVLTQMEALSAAYVAIAVTRHPKASDTLRSGVMALPPAAVNLKRQLVTRDSPSVVPVITAPIAVDPTCAYAPGSFATFTQFQGDMHLVGGVNLPKRISAVDSTGTVHLQLAKDKDDLRQDAVMQQVFVHISALFAAAPSARARRLHMHSYRVVPLGPEVGVIEWVSDTQPLAEYLFSGRGSAHARLRPQDMDHNKARTHLEDGGRTPGVGRTASLRAAYDHVCAHFQPVLHHFFLETFPTAALWYERRLAYTRSVAVSSMVGYIIGLGDRHSSNILIFKTTGELVHIDLGIAFDQGKLLRVPELVPFRLTRDIVDGMGASGVDGVMRRCSEVTLEVLRDHKDSLLTLVEVLIHDPILKWAMSPELAARRQQRVDDSAEEEDVGAAVQPGVPGAPGTHGADVIQSVDAERALLRVRQKLEGVEGGEPRSVEGHVQQLIQDARDPDKLCRMYPGWAPWC